VRLERATPGKKAGLSGTPWHFLRLTPKEALQFIRSLLNQLLANSPNVGRDETLLENGEWFTAMVTEDQSVAVAKHTTKLDTFGAVENAIMQRIIELEGGLEHAVEGKTIDSRVEGLREATMLVNKLAGEAIYEVEDRKHPRRGSKKPKKKAKAKR